jgi:hypothetical protein
MAGVGIVRKLALFDAEVRRDIKGSLREMYLFPDGYIGRVERSLSRPRCDLHRAGDTPHGRNCDSDQNGNDTMCAATRR